MAWSVVTTNLRPVTVREGAVGWRRGPHYRGGRVTPAEGRDLSSRLTSKGAKCWRLGQTLANSAKARQPRPTSHAEVKEGLGPWPGKLRLAQVVASAVVTARPSELQQGTHGPAVARSSSARPFVGESMRLVREPDALVAPVRFDERGVETVAPGEAWERGMSEGTD
jgi:hypothetical protein